MKTAGRENPDPWAAKLSNRAPGAEGQNRSCSFKWAEKQEKIQPLGLCFFLTSPFRELTGATTIWRGLFLVARHPPRNRELTRSSYQRRPGLFAAGRSRCCMTY